MLNFTVKLIKGSIKELITIFITNLTGFICMCVFIAFSFELSNQIKEMANSYANSDDLKTFLSALIIMCVIIIFFVQWICVLMYKVLFIQRKVFNISIKMEGISSSKLIFLYLMESIIIQIVVIITGCLASFPLYPVFARLCGFSKGGLTVSVILLAIAVHVFINSIVVGLTAKKLSEFDIVEEMRSEFSTGKAKSITKSEIIPAVFGICIIFMHSWLAGLISTDERYVKYIKIALIVVGAFFALDTISIIFHQTISEILKKCRMNALYFTQRNILGYYGRVMPIIVTMAIGLMLCIGLNGMFETIRTVAREAVTQNVYFSDAIIYQDFTGYITDDTIAECIGTKKDKNIQYCTSLAFIVKEGSKTTIISGINSDYFKHGEKMTVDLGDFTYNDFNNPEWNGIVLPDYMLTKSMIGEKYNITILGKELDFIIAGSFAANGYRGRYVFVSLPYLQKALGAYSLVNAVYIDTEADITENLLNMSGVYDLEHITKDQIEQESYNNIVKSTQIITIASYVTFACSLFMLISFLVMTAKQNISDMIRLRAIGISKGFTLRIYIYLVMAILAEGSVLGLPMAYFFADAGTHLFLRNINVSVFPILSYKILVLLLGIIASSSIISMMFLCKAGLNNNYTNFLREKSN